MAKLPLIPHKHGFPPLHCDLKMNFGYPFVMCVLFVYSCDFLWLNKMKFSNVEKQSVQHLKSFHYYHHHLCLLLKNPFFHDVWQLAQLKVRVKFVENYWNFSLFFSFSENSISMEIRRIWYSSPLECIVVQRRRGYFSPLRKVAWAVGITFRRIQQNFHRTRSYAN